jgi:hypothetical protein
MKAVGKNRFFAREIVIQRTFQHICGGGDLLHGDLGVSMGSEEIDANLD